MIDLKSYLDVFHFLQDFYHDSKKNRTDFSYEIWARDLGVTSKSYLRFAVLGKRAISEELTEKFCNYFQFNDLDREYFVLLALYSQSTQPTQKKIYGQRLAQTMRRAHQRVEEIPVPESGLTEPIYIVLRNLISFSDLEATPSHLASILSISEEKVLSYLHKLQEAEWAIQDGSRWRAVHDNVRVQDGPSSQAMQNYHRLSLQKAIESQRLPVDQRHFRALNIAFTEDEYASYLHDLNEFIHTLMSRHRGNDIHLRRVYQINFNLFPWTEQVVLTK